jgi:primase-polymerase (primpol)-like protein
MAPSELPPELTGRKQWLLWRYEHRDGRKPTKVPFTCTGHKASTTNPQHWSSFDDAVKMSSWPGFADGLGFVFTPGDPFCGVDLDHVWQSDADEGAPWAEGILQQFSDTYAEQSPSETGVKIWCRAIAPRSGRWPIHAGEIEIYDRARYFAVTGRHAGVLTIADHQRDIERLIENLENGRGARSRIITGAIPQGQRHPALVSLAGTMWRRGMCLAAIEAALLEVNAKQCDPPRPPEHIHRIVQSMRGWER